MKSVKDKLTCPQSTFWNQFFVGPNTKEFNSVARSFYRNPDSGGWTRKEVIVNEICDKLNEKPKR